jgi:AcrR family transcriptional regulator
MPRPRTASDAEILEGVARAISRVGPGRLTLTDVGREVGLSPATLLQRFGSKRGLLLALAQHAASSIDACFAAVRSAAPSPIAGLIVAATEMARHVESPEALANHLAFLQVDLSDPDFHALALAGSTRTLEGYESLLQDGITAQEIVPCDVARLARVIQAVTGGSLINWAIHRRGPVMAWLSTDLEAVLAPYRRRPPEATHSPPDRAAPRTRHRAAGAPPHTPTRGARATPDSASHSTTPDRSHDPESPSPSIEQ